MSWLKTEMAWKMLQLNLEVKPLESLEHDVSTDCDITKFITGAAA